MPPNKKAAPEGAAKFREETPRKGGGIPKEDFRNAALQQYGGSPAAMQQKNRRNFSRIMLYKS
jgi:hypothetical protein